MNYKILKTEVEYKTALARMDKIFSAQPGTPEGAELEMLSLILEEYEDRHFPIDPPEPIDAIKFRMEQQGLRRADLAPFIGSKSRVSEVLGGKRSLSLAMIRRLHKGLGIALEILVQELEPKRKPARRPKAARRVGTAAQAKAARAPKRKTRIK